MVLAKHNNFTESIKLNHNDFETVLTVGSKLKNGYT